MKPKNTILLFVVAAGLFAFIYFYENKLPTTDQAAENGKHVVSLDADAIEGITITNNEDKIELRKDGLQWEMTAPVKDRADSMAVNQLMTGLDMLNVDNSFAVEGKGNDKTSLKELGLETSSVRVKFSGKNVPPEILFGKDAAVEGKMYVRLDGSKTVFVVNNDLRSQLQKKADDFRDRKLMDIDAKQVGKFTVKSAAGEISMVKERGDWSIDKPLKARGDSQKINDLIAQTINAHIDTFENGANENAYGLNEPEGTITLTVEGGQPAALQIGHAVEKDKEKVYAKLSTRKSVYTLSKNIGNVLNIKPNDVRDRHLLKLNFDTVDRIHLDAQGRPEITLARKGEDWTLKTSGDAQVNTQLMKKLAADLLNQQVAAFVTDVTSDLPKYGLDKPQLKVTFGAYASENTAESKAGETPILTLDFGRVEGDVVYARLESEPYVVSVSKKILESVPTDPVLWRDLAILKSRPDDITSIEVTRDGQTLAMERGTGNGWKLVKGAGTLNQINVVSLQNLLANLHAVRWTGSATSGLGLEKPAMVFSFGSSGKQSGKLTIGNVTAENMWNAEAAGFDGAFLVSKPDYDTLRADLIEAPKPSATASPGALSPSASPAGVK